jgi:hypothetical protein
MIRTEFMLSDKIRKRIEKATVKTKTGGQGVVVPGNMILTAAHCLSVEVNAFMGVQEQPLQEVECNGNQIMAQIYAVEPMRDIAVLGAPDSQRCAEEYFAFKKAIERIDPVEIRPDDLKLFKEIPAEVYTHERTWITGKVQQGGQGEVSLSMTITDEIKSGTSGGPVVDQEGCLLGVVSTFSEGIGEISLLHLALPVWIVRQILECQT